VVHLRGFGFVRVFRTLSRTGEAEYWATNHLGMSEEKRAELEQQDGGGSGKCTIRGLKQCCGVEQAQVRKAVSILRHLLLALRAFLRLEVYRLRRGGELVRGQGVHCSRGNTELSRPSLHILQPTA
jgi:putative transposase